MKIPDICLIGPITDVSGMAEVSRNLYLALTDMGIKVKLLEIPGWSHLKADLHPEISERIEEGFNRSDLQAPAVIHFYPPHAVIRTPVIEQAAFNVSYTVFETDKCPLVWRDALNSQFFVENWAPCSFNLDAYALGGLEKKKLRKIPLGVDVNRYNPDVEPMKIEGQTPFTLMTSLDWSERKNPQAMVAAFMQEFNNEPDACFVIKSYTGYADEESKNKIRSAIQKLRMMTKSNAKVLLVTDFLHADKMASLHKAASAWVNLSRGEGWDMGSIQSMACGIPVVAAANTAHLEYMDQNNSYLVKSTKMPITNKDFLARNPQFFEHSWWEADVKHARTQMRKAFDDWKSGQIKEVGKLARARACDFKWQNTAKEIIFHLGKYYNN